MFHDHVMKLGIPMAEVHAYARVLEAGVELSCPLDAPERMPAGSMLSGLWPEMRTCRRGQMLGEILIDRDAPHRWRLQGWD